MSYQRLYINGIPVQNPFPTNTQPSPETRLQYKQVTIRQNGEQNIQPDQGYDGLSRVGITTDVQPPLQSLSQLLNPGETTIVTPSIGNYGLSAVTSIVRPLNVTNISGTLSPGQTTTVTAPTSIDGYTQLTVAALPPNNQTKTTSITTNGNYSYVPDNGYNGLARLDLSVEVPTPTAETIVTTIDPQLGLSPTRVQLTPTSNTSLISLADVTVDTSSQLLQKQITSNGSYTYDPTEESTPSKYFYGGYIQVNVPQPTAETITTTITQNTQLQLTPSSPDKMISLVNLDIDVPSSAPIGYDGLFYNQTKLSSITLGFNHFTYDPGHTMTMFNMSSAFYRNTTLNHIFYTAWLANIQWQGNDLISYQQNYIASYMLSSLELTYSNSQNRLPLLEFYGNTLTQLTNLDLQTHEHYLCPATLNNLINKTQFTQFTSTTSLITQLTPGFSKTTSISDLGTIDLSDQTFIYTDSGTFQPSTLSFIIMYDTELSNWYFAFLNTMKTTLTMPSKYIIKYCKTYNTYYSATCRMRLNSNFERLFQIRPSSSTSSVYLIKILIFPELIPMINLDLTPPNAMEEE